MEKSILMLIIIIGFSALLLLPTLLIMYRAKKYNINLSFGRAIVMKLRNADSRKIFEAYDGYKKNGMKGVTLNDIEAHILAGGNPMNCLEGYIYAKKQGLNPDYRILTAIDLSGRNVKDDFEEVSIKHDLKIPTLKNDNITIDYYLQFKYKHANLLQTKDTNEVQNKIEKKLVTFLNSWNGNEPIETEKLIRDNILNSEYFENNVGIAVLKQDYVIRKSI